MKVLLGGSHGLIGQGLTARLAAQGHTAVGLVRPGGGDGVRWDPEAGQIDRRALCEGGFDAVVNLAGAGIGDRRWTQARRREIASSRIDATRLLVEALDADGAPRVLVNASAVGYYGDRGDEILTESSGPGSGFLAEVCQGWEAAALEASAKGVRVAVVRTGIVLSRRGGALARQLPLFRLGLGGRLGRGSQFTSWITLDDETSAIVHALENPGLEGPVNATAPNPVTNAQMTAALGASLHRPAFLSVPAPALRLALGSQLADEMILASQRVVPTRLQAEGFVFAHPTLDSALAAVLGRAL